MGEASASAVSVALVTCAALPDLSDDDRLLATALERRGARVVPTVWSDVRVDWASFDAIVVRSCWDYFLRTDEFFAWLSRLETEARCVLNDLPLLRWNSRKTYLRDLEARGITIVPTRWLARGTPPSLAAIRRETGWSELVVKPVISASAHDTWRSSPGNESQDDARLGAMTSRVEVLVQPLLEEVVTGGEWSIAFFDGEYSHAVLKHPRAGEFRVQSEHGGTVTVIEPPPRVIAQASLALRCAPAGERALYARVDGCIVGDAFVLMELELIEPALFLGTSARAAERLADATLARVRQGAELTRQIVLPTSSATSNAPRESIATPTGRPCASPASVRNPVSTSTGVPAGFPPANGTKMTL